MAKGRVSHDPQFRYADAHSKREVWRVTDYLGHSNHLYYTDPRWLAGNRSMLFTPDGKAVLYSSDLTSYSNIYLVAVGEFEELPRLGEDL